MLSGFTNNPSDRGRKARITLIALTAIVSYLLHGPHVICPPEKLSLEVKNDVLQKPVEIFYNMYTNRTQDSGRVLRIFYEQARLINPALHNSNISIISIGVQPSHFPTHHIRQHYNEGGEDITLHSLWEYCSDDKSDSKVVYLHSKGSYHPSEYNDRLRRFMTEGALSRECANLPDDCDVCSSRMSPHPHPHTSGNMWLARCSYIRKLRDPFVLKDGELPQVFAEDNGCMGFGRYFFEHWVHSHPSVRPCDLYPGKEYTWAHSNIPDIEFKKELWKAPRFDFDVYVGLLRSFRFFCLKDKSPQVKKSYLQNRMWGYKQLYNISTLDKSWYLWKFLNITNSTKTKFTSQYQS